MLVNVYQTSSHGLQFSQNSCLHARNLLWSRMLPGPRVWGRGGRHCFKFIRLLRLGPFSWESYKDPVPSERFQWNSKWNWFPLWLCLDLGIGTLTCLSIYAVLVLPTKHKELRGRDDKSLYESALALSFGFIKMMLL